MEQNQDFGIEVDEEGRLILPEGIKERYGIRPNTRIRSSDLGNGLFVSSPTRLAKLYIEPTSRCNLACRTCIRNSWNEQPGMMSEKVFDRIVSGLSRFSPRPTVFIGGYGEPLLHPDIPDMVRRIKSAGSSVELITNGTLLTPKLSQDLIRAGINTLWISLDGASQESYADIRIEGDLPLVLENLRAFHTTLHNGLSADSWKVRPGLTGIGIIFVAMKRNIEELPEVIAIGRKLGADRFMVTNAVPYAETMSDESIYDHSFNHPPVMTTPRIGRDKAVLRELSKCGVVDINMDKIGFGGELGRCPFIAGGSAALTWDGGFSPCLPLMHSHSHYYKDRLRFSKRWVVGNLGGSTLEELWNKPEHLDFRRQVQLFDFSPCTICHGCILNEKNEEDCLGNAFPTCGACLWAQGIIQCP